MMVAAFDVVTLFLSESIFLYTAKCIVDCSRPGLPPFHPSVHLSPTDHNIYSAPSSIEELQTLVLHHFAELGEVYPAVGILVDHHHDLLRLPLRNAHEVDDVRHDDAIRVRLLEVIEHHAQVVLLHHELLVHHERYEIAPVERVLPR